MCPDQEHAVLNGELDEVYTTLAWFFEFACPLDVKREKSPSRFFSLSNISYIVLTADSTSTSVRHCVITALFIVYADSLERGVGGTLMKLSNDWVDL